MDIRLKRIYDGVSQDDGYRVLADGIWPRGVAKKDAALDDWCKELAPSKELRQWFGHERDRWREFYTAYRAALAECDAATLEWLRACAQESRLTLLFAARDVDCNNAVVLRDYLTASE